MEFSGRTIPIQSSSMLEVAFRSILHPSVFLNVVFKAFFGQLDCSFHVRLVGPVCGSLSSAGQIKRHIKRSSDRSFLFVFGEPTRKPGAEPLAEPEHCAASDNDCQSTGNAVGFCQICNLRLPTEMIVSASRMVLCVKGLF